MKKIIAIGIVLGVTGLLWAANITAPIPTPVSVLTATQVASSTPTYAGQLVVCSNCTNANNGSYSLCIATEATTAQNAYILSFSSPTTTTAACK